MEIVTWVLQGSLEHRDSMGNTGVIYPGLAQRMSAGTGILHSEKNGSASERVHFVQMWVVPDESGIEPGYQQADIDDEQLTGGLMTIASGIHDDAAISIHNKNAALHGARLQPGDASPLPDAPFLHLFVPRGDVTLEDAGTLREGDAVRFTGAGGQRVTATAPSEILVWEMHADLAALTGSSSGSIGILVLAGCSTESPSAAVTRARVTDHAGRTGARIRESGVRAGRRSRRPGSVAVRRAAAGADSRRLDDLGVGPGPEGAPGDVDTGRRAAGVGARQRTDS